MSAGRYDAIVVGAGHNGLVTAALLATSGMRIVVLERAPVVGGGAVTEEIWPGYRVDIGARFDRGLDPRAVLALGLERRYEALEPDPLVAALQPDGSALAISRDAETTKAAIRPFSERDAARWDDFVVAMANAGAALRVLYQAAPPTIAGSGRSELFEMARLGMRLGRVGRADAIELMRLIPMTVQELLEEWFESDALLGALAALGCVGIRQGPMAAGTALVLLHGMVNTRTARSTWWPRGGMGALSSAMAEAAREAGVEIRTDAEVDSILVEDGGVAGVVLSDGETVSAGVVASNADPVRTMLDLVDPGQLDPEFVRAVGNIRIEGCQALVHLGVSGLPTVPGLDGSAAAMCVAPSIHYLERAYDDAKYGRVSENPHLEVFAPSVLDPAVAPEGRHVVSIAVQYAPYHLRAGSWDDAACEGLGDRAIASLDAALPGFAERVEHRLVMAPPDIEARFGCTGGHPHHGEMTLDQSFIGRPVPGHARYEMPVRGLYLCGAGAHPGGGVTGAPGVNAARAILARKG